MFAKFKLELLTLNSFFHLHFLRQYYYEAGKNLFERQKPSVHKMLDSYLDPDGVMVAENIEENWFPRINAHVFFSHSHQDELMVTCLAGYLAKEFGILSFIDSLVWDCADDLLKQIDDAHCRRNYKIRISNKVYEKHAYNYGLRNQSTAHVHLILQSALAKMINNTECLIFLNTPASLNVSDIGDKATTSSAWIYNELLMACTFPPRVPERYKVLKGTAHDSVLSENTKQFIKIKYPVPVEKFEILEMNDFVTANKMVEAKIHSGALKKDESKRPIRVLHELYVNKKIFTQNINEQYDIINH